jgi:hypothetical protein
VATRFEVIQDLCPFDLADFGQCFQLDNNLFVANKIGSIRGLQSSAFIKTGIAACERNRIPRSPNSSSRAS